MTTKQCVICGNQVIRRPHESAKRYQAKQTCGWACAKELWRRNRKGGK